MTPSQLSRGQLAHLDAVGYHNLIESELHRLSSPVTHIDPATIDLIALQEAIRQARLRR